VHPSSTRVYHRVHLSSTRVYSRVHLSGPYGIQQGAPFRTLRYTMGCTSHTQRYTLGCTSHTRRYTRRGGENPPTKRLLSLPGKRGTTLRKEPPILPRVRGEPLRKEPLILLREEETSAQRLSSLLRNVVKGRLRAQERPLLSSRLFPFHCWFLLIPSSSSGFIPCFKAGLGWFSPFSHIPVSLLDENVPHSGNHF